MNITLNLLTFRDILTDWETSAALNAARYQEARQPYYPHDNVFKKRIVPVDLARSLKDADPQGNVLFIQLKSVTPVILSMEDFQRWTTSPDYGVVWSASDYPKSLEARIINSTLWSATKEEHFARQHESDRLVRIAATITKYLPPVKDILTSLRGLPDEDSIKRVVAVFESAIGITIYEAPNKTTNETNEESPGGSSRVQQGDEEPSQGS